MLAAWSNPMETQLAESKGKLSMVFFKKLLINTTDVIGFAGGGGA